MWAGVPLVTVSGEQMASRVAGSLLRASGSAAGVVHSLREYHTLAVSLVNGIDAAEAGAAGSLSLSWGRGAHPHGAGTAATTASPPPHRCRWPVVAGVDT